MISYSDLGLISLLSMFFGFLLLVIFGQVTVRKLRKNPETKDNLGFAFMSGDDIYNTAAALALPDFLLKPLEKGQRRHGISVIANKKILLKNTNTFDRFFAKIVFWVLHLSFISLFVFITLDHLTT